MLFIRNLSPNYPNPSSSYPSKSDDKYHPNDSKQLTYMTPKPGSITFLYHGWANVWISSTSDGFSMSISKWQTRHLMTTTLSVFFCSFVLPDMVHVLGRAHAGHWTGGAMPNGRFDLADQDRTCIPSEFTWMTSVCIPNCGRFRLSLIDFSNGTRRQ